MPKFGIHGVLPALPYTPSQRSELHADRCVGGFKEPQLWPSHSLEESKSSSPGCRTFHMISLRLAPAVSAERLTSINLLSY